MAIGGTHPDYDASAAEWARARDVLAGEDAVKWFLVVLMSPCVANKVLGVAGCRIESGMCELLPKLGCYGWA